MSQLGGLEFDPPQEPPRVTIDYQAETTRTPLETLEEYAVREGAYSVVWALDDDVNKRGLPPFAGGRHETVP